MNYIDREMLETISRFDQSTTRNDIFLLEEYNYQGQTLGWMQYYLKMNVASYRDPDCYRNMVQLKAIQEWQRAIQVILEEKDPVIQEQMVAMFSIGNFALDNAFYGKDIHRYG